MPTTEAETIKRRSTQISFEADVLSAPGSILRAGTPDCGALELGGAVGRPSHAFG